MAAHARLVLYGNSVFLAGIKAELNGRGVVELITVEAGCPDPAESIRMLDPCAVLFDFCAAQPDFAIPLLRARPGLILVGIDPNMDQMLLLSGQRVTALSATDLMELVGLPMGGGNI
jgi:hypothetical protein